VENAQKLTLFYRKNTGENDKNITKMYKKNRKKRENEKGRSGEDNPCNLQ